MKKSLRVLLVDDHALVRAGIRALLESAEMVDRVTEADNGREALKLIQTQSPDVVLMDIAMKQLNGLETTARISKDFPNVKVIILSMHTHEEYVIQALRAGASGYLIKDSARVELELAISAVLRDEVYLSPAISKRVIDNFLWGLNDQPEPLAQLTPRQREILQLIAEGQTTKEIAHQLNISIKTVETHRSQLMAKLDIHDVPGLVRFAIRSGLVSLDS
ncbi:MAG: response regulator transcription factor [Acidobacteriota bacterium]